MNALYTKLRIEYEMVPTRMFCLQINKQQISEDRTQHKLRF